MNLKIIAEYVEDEKIIALLTKMGIDYGQGYGISKPRPIKEMISAHLPAPVPGSEEVKPVKKKAPERIAEPV